MIKLVKRSPYFEIRDADIATMRKLEACTSYLVAGHFFSPAFKKRRWDGREHLIKFKRGRYLAPIGLLTDVRAKLDELGLRYRLSRIKGTRPPRRACLTWNEDVKLRDYQTAAIEAFVAAGGRGILKMPIRSGKTKTAGGVIDRLQVRTLFLVPSQMLLHQTVASLNEVFVEADIGLIGDGEWREGKDITVATVQSIAAARGGGTRTCRGTCLRNKSGIKTGEYKDGPCVCGKKRNCDGGRKYLAPASPAWEGLRDGYGLLIMDECFVSGTDVGGRAIEEVRVGDLVPSFDPDTMKPCLKRVAKLFKKAPTGLVRVTSGNRSFVCTPNHPIKTQRGWTPAGLLEISDVVFHTLSSFDAMHVLSEPDRQIDAELGPKKQPQKNRSRLLYAALRSNGNRAIDGECPAPPLEENARGKLQTHDDNESDAQRRDAPEGLEGVDRQGAAMVERWERAPAFAPGHGVAFGDSRRLTPSGIRSDNASSIQAGYSVAGAADCNRSGRPFTQSVEAEDARQEEGCHFVQSRVDSVEILEPGSDGTYGGLCPDGFVYNLEVEDTHTYVANGIAVHNCHHLVGETWHEAFMDIRAEYRLGLSATVYFDLAKEHERGVIWLKACCGNVVHEVSTSHLIERGFLMRQHVKLYKVETPDKNDQEKWSAGLRDECIYANEHRNHMITIMARTYVERGLSVMIVTNRMNQIRLLEEQMDNAGLEYVSITGKEGRDDRADRLHLFRSGRVNVIIGTVFGEGVDVPEVEVLINAEGGTDVKKTVQRMRNLTPSKGKTKAILVDFLDKTNKHLARHSRSRIKTYESEPAFKIRKMWLSKHKDKRA
jgi:superfamily II DNA or RNA helicase